MSSGRPGSLWREVQVRRLALVGLLGSSGFNLLLPAIPLWAIRNGVSPAAAGVTTTVMLAATILAQMAIPALTARFGPGPVLAVGLVALGAPAPLCALSRDLAPLLVIAVVRGCGFGALTVIASTLTASVAPEGRHGESVGIYGLATALPTMLGIPLGTLLTKSGGFAWAAVLAAAPLLAVPAATRLGARPVRGPSMTEASAGLRRRTLLAVAVPSLMLFAVTFGSGAVTTFLQVARPAGLTATVALLAVGTAAVLTRWLIGRVTDRIGPSRLLTAALAAAGAGLLVIAAGLPARVPGAVVVLGGALFGVGYGAAQNLTLVLAFRRAAPRLIPAASALWNASYDAGTGAGAGITGHIADWGIGLTGAIAATGTAIATCAVLAGLARRPAPSPREPGSA